MTVIIILEVESKKTELEDLGIIHQSHHVADINDPCFYQTQLLKYKPFNDLLEELCFWSSYSDLTKPGLPNGGLL